MLGSLRGSSCIQQLQAFTEVKGRKHSFTTDGLVNCAPDNQWEHKKNFLPHGKISGSKSAIHFCKKTKPKHLKNAVLNACVGKDFLTEVFLSSVFQQVLIGLHNCAFIFTFQDSAEFLTFWQTLPGDQIAMFWFVQDSDNISLNKKHTLEWSFLSAWHA